MICRFCGNEMNDGAAFCPHCGAANGAQAPSYSSPEAPVGGGGKKKTGLLIGGAVAAAAVIALIVVALGGLFASPKGQLEKAAGRTFAAYAAAEERIGLPDLTGLSRQQSYSQRMALTLNSLSSQLTGYDMDALSGLGLRMSAGLSGKDRYMGFELGGFWGDEELLSVQMAAEDDEMYFSSPQLTGGTFYGLNTETLGVDLAAMTGDDSIKDVSFNFFDLIDLILEKVDPEAMKQSMKAANKDLWEAAAVKKEGSKTLDVNGVETRTTAYQVTFPQEAMEDYADALAEAMSVMNYYDIYQAMFQAAGVPREEIEEFLDNLEDLDVYGELADLLKDLIGEIGDLELEILVGDGYVSAVRYEGDIRGSALEIALYLGGGKEYVDDLSLELKADNLKVTITSTGDHGGRNGAFTDKTALRYGIFQITSNFRYEPKASGNNLSWSVKLPGYGALDMEGRLETGKDSLDLQLENISVQGMGMELFSLGLDYYAGPYDGGNLSVSAPRLLTEMTREELAVLGLEVQNNAQAWALEMQELFISRLPAELLYGMMY